MMFVRKAARSPKATIPVLILYDLLYRRYPRYPHEANSTKQIKAIVVGRNLVSLLTHFRKRDPNVRIPTVSKNGNGIIPSDDEVVGVVVFETTHSVPLGSYPVGQEVTHCEL